MRRRRPAARIARWIRTRVGQEQGFTMLLALGVMTVVALLTSAALLTVQGDTRLTRADLDGKRAYAAAQAGLQAYLYALNSHSSNTKWWQTCSNDMAGQPTPVTVPGSTTGVSYSYTPVPANNATACVTNDAATLVDNATGALQLVFTGYSGAAPTTRTRAIVVNFRTRSPLNFLWYTVHETIDTSIQGNGCATFYYNGGGPPTTCYIYWVSGDHMRGPMYTQDQFLVLAGGSPTFGRTSKDGIVSEVPTAGATVCAFNKCENAVFAGTAQTNPVPHVPLPTDNTNLLSDATAHGQVFSGTTTITLNGTTANVWNCPSSSSGASAACTNTPSLDLIAHPIIYANNAGTCSSASAYDPTNVNYQPTNSNTHYYGVCGDIYVSGNYTTPLTIAAANNVIVTGDVTTTEDANGNPTGVAALGLVANYYVRVMHTCLNNPHRTIDAAILTLQHSFFVDNYDCGGLPLGQLTVHGAIAQHFRGVVGLVNTSGYLKDYNYDDRLSVTLPPYLFDLGTTAWTPFRETLCTPSKPASDPTSCSYTGP